jgi:vacuolar-type H+-ATPase subunit F/Vma7
VQWACDHAPLVLISVDIAQRLPAAVLDRLLISVTPCVVIVPDVHNAIPMPDLTTRLRQQLGVLE